MSEGVSRAVPSRLTDDWSRLTRRPVAPVRRSRRYPNDISCTPHLISVSTQVLERQEGGPDRWRFELRVRYLPPDLHQLYEKDRVTFHFYYQQVSGPRRALVAGALCFGCIGCSVVAVSPVMV